MSKAKLNQIVQRAISDAAFRRELGSDPKKALKGFDLTADERAAITSGDSTKLTALGVDQRMSKAFGLGVLGDASKTVASDASRAGGVFIDEGATTSAGARVDAGNAARGPASISEFEYGTAGSAVGDMPLAPELTLREGRAAAAANADMPLAPELTLPKRDFGTGTASTSATEPQAAAGSAPRISEFETGSDIDVGAKAKSPAVGDAGGAQISETDVAGQEISSTDETPWSDTGGPH